MDFLEVLDQVLELLRTRGRFTYRALSLQFKLDDETLEALKDELLFTYPVADEEGRGMVWTGESSTPLPYAHHEADSETTTHDTSSGLTKPSLGNTQTPDAERRQLTVMFCDLVGSTQLSSQLDPETYRDVVRAYQTAYAEVIERFDGYIAQYLGDGLLVYFGYPQAHEDDAARAVRAALDSLAAIEPLNIRLTQDHGVQVSVRIGIHTGPVVVGEIGAGMRQEHLAMGETPNIAARIQSLAKPDAVVISATTAHLVQGYFDCQALGEHPLRGVPKPMTVYQVLRESGVQSRLDIAPTLTRLVGRESEVTLLLDRWEQAQASQGQVVLLSGEAGIGKSRLVQMLKDNIAEGRHIRLECRSSPYYQNSALYPIIDLSERDADFHRDDSAQVKLDKLEHMLRQYQHPLEETVPLFAALLSLPVPENRYPSLTLSPQQQRQKTLETTVALLLELAERQPLLFIVEDLHWTDPTTLELLGLLLDQTPTASMFIVLTCRPEFQSTWSPRSYLTGVTLNRLTSPHVEQMVERLTDGQPLPTEVLQQIVEKTDGVPLFVEEMTKAVVESGVLTIRDGQYELVGSLTELAIPHTLQDSLMARLDRLVTAKSVAQYAAVIGRQFSYGLLQAVSQLDGATLQRELQRLVDAELVYQRGLPPHTIYVFKHALIQDTAYTSLLRSTRQHYHQQIAHVMEGQFPDLVTTQPELLAHHAFQGEVWDKAARHFRQAGDRASSRSAFREAVACYEQALEALEHLPQERETLELAIDLHVDLHGGFMALREDEQILTHLHTAETLATMLNDERRLGGVCQGLVAAYRQVGNTARALTYSQRCHAIATALGDMGLQIASNLRLGSIYYDLGDYPQAMAYLRSNVTTLQGELLYERFDVSLGNGLPAINARTYLVWCLTEVGGFAEGITYGDEALELADVIDRPYERAGASMRVGELHLRQGNVAKAIALFERTLALSQATEVRTFVQQTSFALAVAYAWSGRGVDMLTLLEQALEPTPRRTNTVLMCSEASLLADHVAEARQPAQRALSQSRNHNQQGNQARALWLHGEIDMHSDTPETEQAEPYYKKALTLANELGMRPLQAHCHRGLGALHGQTGQPEQARAELSTAIEMYRDMEMTFWLPDTEAALAEVEG